MLTRGALKDVWPVLQSVREPHQGSNRSHQGYPRRRMFTCTAAEIYPRLARARAPLDKQLLENNRFINNRVWDTRSYQELASIDRATLTTCTPYTLTVPQLHINAEQHLPWLEWRAIVKHQHCHLMTATSRPGTLKQLQPTTTSVPIQQPDAWIELDPYMYHIKT